MIDFIVWLVFGALAGWIASMIMKTDDQQGGIANIIVGIIGAIIGGLLSRALGGPDVSGFNLTSLLVAILGAVILLFFLKLFTRRTPHVG